MSASVTDRMPHSPGPWEVREADLGGLEFFIVPAGDQNLNRAIANGNIEHDTWAIEQNRANARLIAAAPELLAACEEFVRKVESGEARSTRSYQQMKAAIAKVKGE